MTTPELAPVIGGTFAIYEDGNGGFVFVADTTQHGVMRKHIPKWQARYMTKLVTAMAGKEAVTDGMDEHGHE